MRYDFTYAAALIAFATFLIVGAAYIFSRRERLLGLKLLGVYALVNAVYSIAYANYLLSDSELHMIGFTRMMFFAVAFLMPVWYLLSVQQRFGSKSFSWRRAVLFAAVPVVAVAALFLYPRVPAADLPWWRTLFFSGHDVATLAGDSWRGFVGIHYEKGVLYYVLAGYSLLVAAFAAWNLFATIRRKEGIARKRAVFLFANALVAVLLGTLTFLSRETVLVDLSPLFADWIAFAAFLALFKYEMFDLIPAAYAEIFRKSDYPIVILDEGRHVVALNASAERSFGASAKENDLRLDLTVLHRDGGVIARELAAGRDAEVCVETDGKQRCFLASATALGRSRKKPTGYFVTYQDVTAHRDEMRRMEQMAAYDDLTKIYNRRYFFRKATEAFDGAVAAKENVRVIMFDLDGFKDINDIYGHQAGDSILAQLAKLVASLLRDTDVFARYGGEEFIIFQKGIDELTARATDRKICEAISGHAFLYQRRNIKVTGSFGVAGSKGPVNKPLERYIKEADDAMYVSKIAGKNQVNYAPDLK